MNISSTPLGFVDFWGIYRAKRRSGGTRGGHNPPGCARRTLIGCAPLGAPPGAALAHRVPSGPKKSPKSFVVFGLRLILISRDVKNKKKNSKWHWAPGQ